MAQLQTNELVWDCWLLTADFSNCGLLLRRASLHSVRTCPLHFCCQGGAVIYKSSTGGATTDATTIVVGVCGGLSCRVDVSSSCCCSTNSRCSTRGETWRRHYECSERHTCRGLYTPRARVRRRKWLPSYKRFQTCLPQPPDGQISGWLAVHTGWRQWRWQVCFERRGMCREGGWW